MRGASSGGDLKLQKKNAVNIRAVRLRFWRNSAGVPCRRCRRWAVRSSAASAREDSPTGANFASAKNLLIPRWALRVRVARARGCGRAGGLGARAFVERWLSLTSWAAGRCERRIDCGRVRSTIAYTDIFILSTSLKDLSTWYGTSSDFYNAPLTPTPVPRLLPHLPPPPPVAPRRPPRRLLPPETPSRRNLRRAPAPADQPRRRRRHRARPARGVRHPARDAESERAGLEGPGPGAVDECCAAEGGQGCEAAEGAEMRMGFGAASCADCDAMLWHRNAARACGITTSATHCGRGHRLKDGKKPRLFKGVSSRNNP